MGATTQMLIATGQAITQYDEPGSYPSSYTKNSDVWFDFDPGRGGWSDAQNMSGLGDVTSYFHYDGTTYYIDSGISVNNARGTYEYNTDNNWNSLYVASGGGGLRVNNSGSPNNTGEALANAVQSFHGWYRVAGAGREVLCSRYGSGYNNQFNHITDPNGNFHWNSTGVSCGAGDCTPGAYTHNEWAYISWQYTTANGGTMEWYVNGILVWRVTSVGTNSNNGLSPGYSADTYWYGVRADDHERLKNSWIGPQINSRAFYTQEQIFDDWLYYKSRFGNNNGGAGNWNSAKHRYWKYTVGSTVSGKVSHPVCNSINFVTITGTNVKTLVDISEYDTPTAPGDGTSFTVDFGGNASGANSGAKVVGVKVDCTEGSTQQASNFTIAYSDDTSTWTNCYAGTISNYLDTMSSSSYSASTGMHWGTTGRRKG